MATFKRPDDEQVLTMLNIIADKHGATILEIDYNTHWINSDCPEETKTAFALEVADLMQNILE